MAWFGEQNNEASSRKQTNESQPWWDAGERGVEGGGVRAAKWLRGSAGVVLAFSMMASGPSVIAGTPSVHERLVHRLVSAAHVALIEYGYCETENDCNKKEYTYWSLTKSSVSLGLYDIYDMRVIAAMFAATLSEYEKSERKVFITTRAYREKYRDVRGVIKPWIVKPYIEFNFRGEQE